MMQWHADPGHGWLAVSRDLLRELGIERDITGYSYVSRDGQTVYLEEDLDAATFAKAWEAAGKGTIKEITELPEDHTNGDSFVRSLPAYEPSKKEDAA